MLCTKDSWLVWSHCIVCTKRKDTEAETEAAKGRCKNFDTGNSTDTCYLPVGWEDDLQVIISITLFWDGANT